MTKEEIAVVLKSCRIKAGLEAKDVAEKLISMGAIKSVKSFYNWESGRTQPDADTFLYLCDLYNVADIMQTFGYRKSAPKGFTGHEKTVIESYRNQPDMQPAVDRLLGVNEKQNALHNTDMEIADELGKLSNENVQLPVKSKSDL